MFVNSLPRGIHDGQREKHHNDLRVIRHRRDASTSLAPTAIAAARCVPNSQGVPLPENLLHILAACAGSNMKTRGLRGGRAPSFRRFCAPKATATPAAWKAAFRKPVARNRSSWNAGILPAGFAQERGGVGSERRTARSGCPTQADAKATAKATAKAKAKGKAKAKAMATPAGWKPALRRAILREFVLEGIYEIARVGEDGGFGGGGGGGRKE